MDLTTEQIKDHVRKAFVLGLVSDAEIKFLFPNLTHIAIMKAIQEGNNNIKDIAAFMRTYESTVHTGVITLVNKGYLKRIKTGNTDKDIYELTDSLKELVEEWQTS